MNIKIIFLATCMPWSAYASQVADVSAKRQLHQPYQQSMASALIKANASDLIYNPHTPYKLAVPVDEISYEKVPEISSYEDLITIFNYVRDNRFMHTPDAPDFLRRISWLYPDDGCFARAASAGYLFRQKIKVKPAKMFAFGDLTVQTPYAKRGSVSWWYHVVPIVAYQNNYFVIDPAIDPNHPMLVQDWFAAMNENYQKEITGVVCHPQTYHAMDNCLKAKQSEKKGFDDEESYLKFEWRRMISLGYEPLAMLGDEPPWEHPE